MPRIRVPRCLQPFRAIERQLHHFADASETAYGVVSYLRIQGGDGRVASTLVMAKSRLAPLKKMTIPRLELQAATLATRQDALLRRKLDMDLARSQYWTDSTIVLQYISNTEARYHTFVANRVAEIQDATQPEVWHHVPTRDNPADDTSRGLSVQELARPRWLHGSEFLRLALEHWPALEKLPRLDAGDPEVKKPVATTFTVQTPVEEHPVERLVASYSNWSRLLRVLACFTMAADVCRKKIPQIKELRSEHVQKAEEALLAHVQAWHYGQEIGALAQGGKLASSSPLVRLRPVLKGGVLVVPGRLSNARLPEEAKAPAVLPCQHPAVESLVRHVHEKTAHSGREYVLAELRRRYWVVGGSSLMKRVLAGCIQCKKRKARPCSQQEADLPPDRVTPGKPAFSSVE